MENQLRSSSLINEKIRLKIIRNHQQLTFIMLSRFCAISNPPHVLTGQYPPHILTGQYQA